MATIITTQTDYTSAGLAQTWTLYDDGTVTITNAQGGTINVAATPLNVAQAQALVAANVKAQNEAALDAKVDSSLSALASFQTSAATARATLATLKSTATTKKSVAVGNITAAQTEIRNIYAGVETVCTQLDAALAALDTATRATATALRLTAGRLDATTGT